MPNRILKDLIKQYPKIKPTEALFLTGLSLLSKDEGGIRNLRSIIQPISTQRTWYRISDGLKKLNYRKSAVHYHSWVKQVTETIDKFEDYKLPTGN